MSLVNGDDWSADLSIPNTINNIEYYIEAEANSGKTLARPIVAPEGYWTMVIENLSNEEWAYNNISGPFPNPTEGKVSFNLNNVGGPLQVSIYNVLGQKLFKSTTNNGNGVITLDLNQYWEGPLFISFEGDFGRVVKKVIKL